MDLQTAKYEALRVFGSYGHARSIRVTDSQGHYKLDYRVGIYSRGKFQDFGRGSTWEKAFEQYAATVKRLEERRNRQREEPTKLMRRVERLREEKSPEAIRAHNAGEMLANYRRSA